METTSMKEAAGLVGGCCSRGIGTKTGMVQLKRAREGAAEMQGRRRNRYGEGRRKGIGCVV